MSTVTQNGSSIWRDTIAPAIRRTWSKRGRMLLLVTVIVMAITAVGRLSYGIPYLVADVAPWAGIDFENRYLEVHRWFSGLPLYGAISTGDYPPATYAMLWPLLGWLAITPARWVWAASTIAAIGAVSYLSAGIVAPAAREQRLFAAVLIGSIYPTQMTLFVGQSGLHVLALLMAGLVVLAKSNGRLRHDLLASLLLVLALVKPTLSVPFFWIVMFVPGRFRPMALVTLFYVVLTFFATLFQDGGVIELFRSWISHGAAQATTLDGTANIHKWMAVAGLDAWTLTASFLMLAVLGFWTFKHRRADVWLLVGVVAIVARLWIHHRLYDDMLILLPMIALLRLASSGPDRTGSDVIAGLLLAATWGTMHIPTWALHDLAPPVIMLIEALQVVVWLSVVVFLVRRARGEHVPAEIPAEGAVR